MNTTMTQNKPYISIRIAWTIKVLFLILALILAYLFALNGRYAQVDTDYDLYFDKWTKTIVTIDRQKTIK